MTTVKHVLDQKGYEPPIRVRRRNNEAAISRRWGNPKAHFQAARIIQVDNFSAQGELPRNLGEAMQRTKDIQYASRHRFNIERIQEFGELAAAARRLLGRQPPELKSDPDAQKLAAACVERSWVIIRLINARPSRLGFVEDYEFSRATIEEAWAAGLEDVRRSISGWDAIQPEGAGPEIVIYRPTEALPLPERAPSKS